MVKSAQSGNPPADADATLEKGKKRGEKRPRSSAPENSATSESNVTTAPGQKIYINKQRVLVLGSRGMTSRYRHLMLDFRALIPHSKTDSKLDSKDNLYVLNEIAEAKSCNTVVFFEVRKKRDLYLWLSHLPNGPTVKLHVLNIHTMSELRLTGNCLKGSRPILSFDKIFDDEVSHPHLRIIRELFGIAFGTPNGHPKSQPFHDHVMHFSYVDNKIWYRHYQIVHNAASSKEEEKLVEKQEANPITLVEIGPRCVFEIVRVFQGSMGGPTLYTNPDYVSPNLLRHEFRKMHATKYAARVSQNEARAERAETLVMPEDPLNNVFK
jgi:ribosome biogenesis protein BRX1